MLLVLGRLSLLDATVDWAAGVYFFAELCFPIFACEMDLAAGGN
jgi:hypothetical protein